METVDISETDAASGLKICRCRQLIQLMKLSIEGHGHFLILFCIFLLILDPDIR